MTGKRSDPAKIRKEREQAARDIQRRSEPSFMESFFGALNSAVERRRRRRNPPPDPRGATVIGTKKQDGAT